METARGVGPESLPPGTRVGPWSVVSQRSQGAWGVVYRVEREGAPEAGVFALKLALHAHDPRFEREVELLSRIQHVQVPRLVDRGWWTGAGRAVFPFIVMEWVEGVPLYEGASSPRLTSRQALRLLAQLARALEATHAVEGVHRDVKGANVLVRESDGSAVLMDFGTGIFRGAEVLTRQHPPPGTPQYQSPESLYFQWRHLRELTARYEAQPADDVYALGVTAYRLVTGRYPPPAIDVEVTEDGTRFVHLELVPPEKWVVLDSELGRLVARMLAHEPSARGSAGGLARDLERAAARAGRQADELIAPVGSGVPAGAAALAAPVRFTRAWRKELVAVAALAFVGVGLWRIVRAPAAETPVEMAQQEPAPESPDAGPARLADTALSARADPRPVQPGRSALGVELPKDPFPGQLRPPCRKPQVAINGGCWVRFANVFPPCGDNAYEWDKGCYWPQLAPPPPRTSHPQ